MKSKTTNVRKQIILCSMAEADRFVLWSQGPPFYGAAARFVIGIPRDEGA